MNFFYNLAFLIFGLFYLPVFLAKINRTEDRTRLLAERWGSLSPEFQEKLVGKRTLWVHAVSVGEVMAVQKVIDGLLALSPSFHIVITTVTSAGQKVAKKMEGPKVSVCYAPFDLTHVVRNFFKVLGPECLLLVETEIWPNLLFEAKRAHIPVGILNARLSEKSAKRYNRFRMIFSSIFKQLDFVLAQSEQDAERFASLGVEKRRVHVLGNIKFDNVPTLSKPISQLVPELKEQWGFDPDDWILVAGSTHPGEEKMLATIFMELRGRYPHLKLLIAPRHIERSAEIAKALKQDGLSVHLSTEGKKKTEVMILDQLGILKDVYALADAVFMGGSFVPRGGQNPIEPAHFKKAILHGPLVFNFKTLYQQLNLEGGALLVRDIPQLTFAWKRLLDDPAERKLIGENAFAVVTRLQGATQRHVDWVSKFLDLRSQPERMNYVEFNA